MYSLPSASHTRAPRALFEEARRAAHRTEGPDRRIDAPRDGALGAGKEFFVATGHAAEGDVVGTDLGALGRARPVGVAGEAEDALRAERRARRRGRAVLAAEVGAVGIDGEREREVVIDDEGYAGGPAGVAQRQRLLAAQAGVGALVAVLQQRRAAGEHGVREREQAPGVGVVGGDRRRARAARVRGSAQSSPASLPRAQKKRSGSARPMPAR
jgi:hypothetical protein